MRDLTPGANVIGLSGMLAELGTHDRAGLVAIALGRLLLPLLIPRFRS
jgi:hypothetical protein